MSPVTFEIQYHRFWNGIEKSPRLCVCHHNGSLQASSSFFQYDRRRDRREQTVQRVWSGGRVCHRTGRRGRVFMFVIDSEACSDRSNFTTCNLM